MTHLVAVDLGAESGRVAKVTYSGASLTMEVAHRFPNIQVEVGKTLYWDTFRLWHEIKTGIDLIKDGARSIGVDTWGVDFALLDRDGNLLGNPVCYRDSRTDGAMEWTFKRVPRREIFERTGSQFLQLNTLYQLASLLRANSPLLEVAATYLGFPDLINYWLTGVKACEFTHATTTQFYNPRARDWDRQLLGAVGLPTDIYPHIVQPGTRLGDYRGIPVIAPPTHDTGSAVIAVPTTTRNFAYISSGTWSLIGLEIETPIINDAAYEANVTNEGGAEGKLRFLKNIMGLWLVQQSRAAWRAEGTDYSYDQLATMATDAPPFLAFIDPDDPSFFPPGDMPARIREFCARTGQVVPETPGAVLRVIYESLALRYREALDKMIALSGQTVDRMHIIGGGSQNAVLCQMTADAIGRPVYAGPVEATVLGNAIVQLIALGELQSVADGRALLSQQSDIKVYEPKNTAAWDAAFARFKGLGQTS
ncbi:MAG: rhamnulokinase [Anaerolineae bacterium]|nr:rhamnulokinase [Anaerolineae bacterium]